MINESHIEISLHLLGYRKNAGYRKGWYRTIYSSTALKNRSLGVLFCGTDPLKLFNEELKKLYLEYYNEQEFISD